MPKPVGLTPDGRLQPPPKSPNCVTSMTEPGNAQQYIAPIGYRDLSRDEARTLLIETIEAMPLVHQIEAQSHYLRYEFRTKMLRFTDDVEFLLSEDEPVIHMRSASRLGYSDWGTNRKRLEAVRMAFTEKMLKAAKA